MEVSVVQERGHVVVRPTGPVDTLTADELQGVLLGLIEQDPQSVELDFGAVPYLSSAGLRALVLAAKAMRDRGHRLRMTALQPTVLSVLEIAGLTAYLDIAPPS
jgi:anti-anti-sigma factor